MRTTSEPRVTTQAADAIAELKALIRQRYPKAAFEVARGQDDRDAIHLIAEVDVEDRSEVLDVVLDRLMELQIDHDLPLFVIVTRPPERDSMLYRLVREQASQPDDEPEPDSEATQRALSLAFGSWADLDADQIIEEVYEARRVGSRPLDRL